MQGVGLALQALAIVVQSENVLGMAQQCKLVIAGGYDMRLAENKEHLCELQSLAKDLGLQDKVVSGPR